MSEIKLNNYPTKHKLVIKNKFPKDLECLKEIAYNLKWSWDYDMQDMFRVIAGEKKYKQFTGNPVAILNSISSSELYDILGEESKMRLIRKVYKDFRNYMEEPVDTSRASVAYLCMEYGLNQNLKIYSGGLGVLAGDYLKEASDSNVDMCAVGFLYRYGYFKQTISDDGHQIANYDSQDFNNLPVQQVMKEDGSPLVVDVPYLDYYVHTYVWQVNVGRIKLYLLDTDNDLNSSFDREITHALYGGNWENRIKQEILLGIGGILTLKKLGIKKDVYHCNEGHAAFCNVQRLVDYIKEDGLNFDEALEVVRSSSLYTVHTPVPAGHDYFEPDLFYKYMSGYAGQLGISYDDFIGMGRINPFDKSERFCMSTFACKTSSEINGVSYLHGEVSKKMFEPIWNGYYASESHVGYVTNGVHFPTWCNKHWRDLYNRYFDNEYINDQSNDEYWKNIYKVSSFEVYETHQQCKRELIEYIGLNINPDTLLIGFGRRFATYKRAHLLFTDLDRLEKIVNNTDRPVCFLYTGKAHPADGAGQGLIKKIYDISKMPQFKNKVFFLENYDMELAKKLISGVDIWLNTPTRPMEASGTSGEKALMNGVVNFSVLDGWWYEGYREGAGWALTDKRTYNDQGKQDKLDANTIYNLFEQEICHLYYDSKDEWVNVMKNSIAKIAPHYTMKRQLDDYYSKFYNKMRDRMNSVCADNYALAKNIVHNKNLIKKEIDNIEVEMYDYGFGSEVFSNRNNITSTVDLKCGDYAPKLDLLIIDNDKLVKKFEHKVTTINNGILRYTADVNLSELYPKTYNYVYRLSGHIDGIHSQEFVILRYI